MFDIGWTELLVIAVVAIVVIGPKDLPRAFRSFGRWTAKMKGMARDFRRQFDEALREAEIDQVKKEVESVGKLDPLAMMKGEAKKVEKEIKAGLDKPVAASADREIASLQADRGTAEPSPVVEAKS